MAGKYVDMDHINKIISENVFSLQKLVLKQILIFSVNCQL